MTNLPPCFTAAGSAGVPKESWPADWLPPDWSPPPLSDTGEQATTAQTTVAAATAARSTRLVSLTERFVMESSSNGRFGERMLYTMSAARPP